MDPLASIGKRLVHLLGRFVGGRSAREGVSTVPGLLGTDAAQDPHPKEPHPSCEDRIPYTTVPTPPQYGWAEDLHEQHRATLATAGDLDLLLVGDSLTQHWSLDAWSPWRAFSLGVGGDGTQHVLWRVERIAWGTCRPKRVLIAAGTNNLIAGDGPADIAAGVDAIASRLEAAHPGTALFVLLPPPLGIGLQGGIGQRRALRKLLASRFRHRLIDADAAMGAVGREPNPNYQEDLVHFTDRGYEVLTGLVRARCR